MSVRMIARDLYRFQQEVDRLEGELKSCPLGKREEIQDRLRKARAERDRLKHMLDGAKEEPSYRKPR